MKEIIIDEEFRLLLPILDETTFRLLEENILEYGCRDPLILWNGILIDGYNRYKICNHHQLPFTTVDMEFDSREEVLIWIISNQISRRNLTPIQLSYFRGLHYLAERKIQGRNNQYIQEGGSGRVQNGQFPSTAKYLSEQYRVSGRTIRRDAELATAVKAIGNVSYAAKEKILSGQVQIGRNRLRELSNSSDEEIEVIAAQIENNEYENRPSHPSASDQENEIQNAMLPEIKQLNQMVKDFAVDFQSALIRLGNGKSAELKVVLRSYIEQLEDLYKRMQ